MGTEKNSNGPRASASSSERQAGLPPATFMLMGKTGSGKSSFIRLLGGRDPETGSEPDVDGGTGSATVKVASYECTINSRRVTLIDTPGFDDDVRGDSSILLDISSELLRLALGSGSPLRGIIFLHDITEKRYSGSQKKTLSILRDMCGKGAMGNVIIGTTMWLPDNKKRFSEQEVREAEILKKHWDGIHSTVRLFENDLDAAVGIVTALLSVPRVNLLVQDEMGPTGILSETTVGKTMLAEGRDEIQGLKQEGNDEDAGILESMMEKLKRPADLTFAEKFGLAIAAPIVLAPTALVAAPVGVIYALVHGANYLSGSK
ncbi:P-loop containing nucleoside triphosphate hydrolase protein [Morchella snyderi]|nr:P-loop containing nucleoside triphosphate hydrolase protein [Morchella snyderi]